MRPPFGVYAATLRSRSNDTKIMLKRRGLSVRLTGVHAHRWRHNYAHERNSPAGWFGDC